LALADLVNLVLSDYGNATGASFDLTNMSNMVGMGGMQLNDTTNNTTMMTSDEHVQMSANTSSSSSDATTMTIGANATSSMINMTANIVDAAAYQSAQYLANNTILRLFNDTLKPLTMSSTETSADKNSNNNATTTTQEAQDSSTTQDGNMTSNIGKLEAGLLRLKDDINGKATSNEVMITAHVNIHPVLMQIYGLVLEQER
jgi:archaellin